MTCLMTPGRLGLALALLTACAGDDLPNADLPAFFDVQHAPAPLRAAARAVVRIQHPSGSSGTGSFISPDGLLLTNDHVLGGSECAREGCAVFLSFELERGAMRQPPRTVFAVPQHVDVGLDMSVLQIFSDELKTQRLATPDFLSFESRTSQQLLGEQVTAIGHPFSGLKKWSTGYVIWANGDWFETSLFSLPGSSGSPILNADGRIVGLLHRGADGFDKITETSTHVSAIGSASASLQAASSSPLPSSVISLAERLSAGRAGTYSAAFLAASQWTANVEGKQIGLVSLLAALCDHSLARDDYTSLEELRSSLSACSMALRFVECRSDVPRALASIPKECPSAEREVWLRRLRAVSDKLAQFNGTLDLASISSSTEVLASSQSAGQETARANIIAALDRANPTLDFNIASFLAVYEIESYANQNTRELILNYAKVPFYERYALPIASAALWLSNHDQLTREQGLKVALDLYRDAKVNLGSKLRLEELLYRFDAL